MSFVLFLVMLHLITKLGSIARSFTDAVVNDVFFLIFLPDSLLVYVNTTDFYFWKLY